MKEPWTAKWGGFGFQSARSANRLHTNKLAEPFPKDLHKQTNQKAKQTHRGGSEGHGGGGPEDRDSVKGFGC